MERIILKLSILLTFSLFNTSCHPTPRVSLINQSDVSVEVFIGKKNVILQSQESEVFKDPYQNAIKVKKGQKVIELGLFSSVISNYYLSLNQPYRPVFIIDNKGVQVSHYKYSGEGKYALVESKNYIVYW